MSQLKEQPLEQLLCIDCFTVWMFHGGIILSVPLEEDLLGWGLWWNWESSIFTILCCILVYAAEGISAFKPLLCLTAKEFIDRTYQLLMSLLCSSDVHIHVSNIICNHVTSYVTSYINCHTQVFIQSFGKACSHHWRNYISKLLLVKPYIWIWLVDIWKSRNVKKLVLKILSNYQGF